MASEPATSSPPVQPPQPKLMEPMERPTNPDGTPVEGTRGREIKLEINAFQMVLTSDPDPIRTSPHMAIDDKTVWYQYNVVINIVKKDKSNAVPPKKKLRAAWAALEKTGIFDKIKPVYDGRNICFSPSVLPDDALKSIDFVVPDDGNYRIMINDPIELRPCELVKWYTGKGDPTVGDVQSCLAALNVLFAHGPGLLLPSNKTTFFINNPRDFGLTDAHKPAMLPRGVELWRGFFQSVRAAHNTLYQNIDTTSGAFIQSGNMVDFLKRFLGTSNFHALDERDRLRLNRLLRHCGVLIEIPGVSGGPMHRKIGVGITQRDARSTTFKLGDSEKEISIEDYFKKTYSCSLKQPHLPCVEIKKGTIFPMEFVSIKPGNKYLKKLDAEQQLRATDFQTLRPSERLKAITAISASQDLTRPYLPQFGIEVSQNPRKVLGRVLAPPIIDYKASGTQRVDQGVWRMQKGRTRLAEPTQIKSYAIVASVQERKGGDVMQSMVDILRGCSDLGIRFPAPPRANIVFIHDPKHAAEETLKRAIDIGGSTFGSRPEILFWIFEKANDPDYHTFKAFGMREGIATQALQMKNCQARKAGDFQFLINMSLKMNAKNRGWNHSLQGNSTNGAGAAGWLDKNPAMVFGADVSHLEGRPSIATVVASMDRAAICYADVTTVQGLIEPSEIGGRAKRQEIIQDLAEMVFKLLKIFLKTSNRVPPPSFIFYRDGVSESEWAAVMTKEIEAIKEGVERFKESEKDNEKHKAEILAFDPKLTFLLAMKRHHIRAFGSRENKSVEGKSDNIPAGTVIDSRHIADARVFDWYAAAHTGILGTTKPTRYVVMTGNRAVSLPAPVYYADVIAGKIRGWMPAQDGETISSDSNGSPHSRESDLAFCKTYLRDLEAGHAKYLGEPGERAKMWWM